MQVQTKVKPVDNTTKENIEETSTKNFNTSKLFNIDSFTFGGL